MQRDGITSIGIIGAGVVGGALRDYLASQGRDVRVYDPPKGYHAVEGIATADVVFICVPTPYVVGRGFDDTFLHQAIAVVPTPKVIVIKSTVLPGTTELLQERHPQHRFLFNPEFLREATAHEDFLRPDRQIVGHTDRSAALADTVMALLPRAPFERTCPASEAEMAKYMANCFLALKVIYANEIADLCERLQIDYDGVRAIAGADARIGPSHLDVFDGGYRGYGGKCLPKDSKSLLDLARAAGVELQLLRAADRVNARLRDQDHVAPPVVLPLVNELIAAAERAA
ncbi:MAG TPA: hypothetical protein VFC53_03470 [Dehalococcoidia bacterium]|nr:hypothetical protein [Dehalococcoidia bacterium]